MEPHDEKGDSEVQFAKKSLEMKSLLSKTILSKNQMEPHDEKGDSEVQLKKEINGSLKRVPPWSEISVIEIN